MNNQQLIKSAHVWFLAVLLGCGLWAIAGTAGVNGQSQNSNQNSNSNSNSNSNTANDNRSSQNANRSSSRNANATGEQTGMTAGMSSQDRDFIMDAAMGGLMEVELGRIAAQQGASDAVKQFGQKMVDDHSQANTELTTLATSKGITLPTALDDKQRQQVTKLSAMSGAEFDRAYVKMMVSDHNKDVKAFEKQSTRGTDPDVKAFAGKTLPTLQEHLTMIKTLDSSQKGSNSNSGGSKNSNSSNSNNSNRP